MTIPPPSETISPPLPSSDFLSPNLLSSHRHHDSVGLLKIYIASPKSSQSDVPRAIRIFDVNLHTPFMLLVLPSLGWHVSEPPFNSYSIPSERLLNNLSNNGEITLIESPTCRHALPEGSVVNSTCYTCHSCCHLHAPLAARASCLGLRHVSSNHLTTSALLPC